MTRCFVDFRRFNKKFYRLQIVPGLPFGIPKNQVPRNGRIRNPLKLPHTMESDPFTALLAPTWLWIRGLTKLWVTKISFLKGGFEDSGSTQCKLNFRHYLYEDGDVESGPPSPLTYSYELPLINPDARKPKRKSAPPQRKTPSYLYLPPLRESSDLSLMGHR